MRALRTWLWAIAIVAALIARVSVQERKSSPSPTAERRLALVVGNNAYPSAPLRNAVPDAASVSKALRDLGFEVTTVTDAGLVTLERAVESYVARLMPDDVALFYFSGHGVQVEGENYLIPIDFKGTDEADVKYGAYSASRIHEKLESRARIRIVVLDACRNNPFRASRSASAGLAEMTARGSLIAFATSPGSTASDNPGGKNGLFTEKLLEALSEPSLSASELFRQVRRRVNEASKGRQFPWLWDGLIGDFVFRPGGISSVSPTTRPATSVAVDQPKVPVASPLARFSPPQGPLRSIVNRAMRGDAGAAFGIAMSPGSRFVAAGYESGVVKLWDPGTGREIGLLSGQLGNVTAVALSSDARHLAATSADRTVRVWNLDTSAEESRLVGHADVVLAVAFSADGRMIASGAADSTVRTWDALSGRPREVFNGHTGSVTSVGFAQNGRTLVSGSQDQTVRVWDPVAAKEVMTLDAGEPVWSVSVTRDLSMIAAGTASGKIVVWDGETGQVKWNSRAHAGAVWAVAFSPDGKWFASGGADGVAQVRDVATWQNAHVFRGHTSWVRGLAFDDASSWLVSSGGDGDVRTWRLTK